MARGSVHEPVSSKPKARRSAGRPCWTVKRLGPHQSRTYEVTVRALDRVGRSLTDTAAVTADDGPAAPSERCAWSAAVRRRAPTNERAGSPADAAYDVGLNRPP